MQERREKRTGEKALHFVWWSFLPSPSLQRKSPGGMKTYARPPLSACLSTCGGCLEDNKTSPRAAALLFACLRIHTTRLEGVRPVREPRSPGGERRTDLSAFLPSLFYFKKKTHVHRRPSPGHPRKFTNEKSRVCLTRVSGRPSVLVSATRRTWECHRETRQRPGK